MLKARVELCLLLLLLTNQVLDQGRVVLLQLGQKLSRHLKGKHKLALLSWHFSVPCQHITHSPLLLIFFLQILWFYLRSDVGQTWREHLGKWRRGRLGRNLRWVGHGDGGEDTGGGGLVVEKGGTGGAGTHKGLGYG